ncbi:MAG TPA: glycine cleavage system protein GcvH [Bacteroidetes bacterium]|nr:glycine cleavage system protein GcvH [Bacteroidota bacterium]
MSYPAELLYTKDHEWLRIEGNVATVGITHYAQGELGDIVYVDVEALDDNLEEGAVFGSIEAVKTVSDLFMPVAGTITELNEAINDAPDVVNSDPYGEGWIVKIEMAEGAGKDHLMDVKAYMAEIGA